MLLDDFVCSGSALVFLMENSTVYRNWVVTGPSPINKANYLTNSSPRTSLCPSAVFIRTDSVTPLCSTGHNGPLWGVQHCTPGLSTRCKTLCCNWNSWWWPTAKCVDTMLVYLQYTQDAISAPRQMCNTAVCQVMTLSFVLVGVQRPRQTDWAQWLPTRCVKVRTTVSFDCHWKLNLGWRGESQSLRRLYW